MLITSVPVFAQKDVTQFLGIPVDGFKPAMIRELKAKGFVSSSHDTDVLEGEFNGAQVYIYVVTNNNKVYRIMIADAKTMDETAIKIRFNKLCQQFENNGKYISDNDYTISDDEDISYEMAVNNKRYEAIFYQQVKEIDSLSVASGMMEKMLKKYTEEQLANPSEEIQKDLFDMSLSYAFDIIRKKSVWFMISEYYGEYYITMFYDNEYNRANGEDL